MGNSSTRTALEVSRKNYFLDVILHVDSRKQLFNRQDIEKCRRNDECTVKRDLLKNYREQLLYELKHATGSNVYKCGLIYMSPVTDTLLVDGYHGKGSIPIEEIPSQIRLVDRIIDFLRGDIVVESSDSDSKKVRLKTFRERKMALLREVGVDCKEDLKE